MSKDLLVMFLLVGSILAVFGTFFLVVVLFHEFQKQEFFKEVTNLGYEEGMKREFKFLFGDSALDRSRDSSRQLVSNFGKEDYQIKYLQKYFGLRINDEIMDHLDNVCKWNRALDKICQQTPKFEKFKGECYPVFSMQYTSPAGRSSVEETFVFSSKNTKKLLSQVEALVLRQQSKKFQRTAMTHSCEMRFFAGTIGHVSVVEILYSENQISFWRLITLFRFQQVGKQNRPIFRRYAGNVTGRNQTKYKEK